jgi:hypothetical protein
MSFASPIDLYHVAKRSWSAETIVDPFNPANPSLNQCAVTALAVRHYFGGDILKTATKGGTHFYNLIEGRCWDLTTDQFGEPIPYDNMPSSVDEAHQHARPEHLAALLRAIDANS